MWRVSKTFSFSAAHRLDTLNPDHKCYRMHGHNYTVQIVVAADDLDENGFVVDFGDLAPVGKLLDLLLDHRTINDNPMLQPATSEVIAYAVYTWCADLPQLQFREGVRIESVRVSETPTTWAEYTPGTPRDEVLAALADQVIAAGGTPVSL